MLNDDVTVKFMFETGAQVKFEANLKEKFNNTNGPNNRVQTQLALYA